MAKGKKSKYLCGQFSLKKPLILAERLREKHEQAADAMEVDGDKPLLATEYNQLSHDSDLLKALPGSGVQKSRSKKKHLRKNQRLRLERGVERAETTMDQLQKKVGASKQKSKVIKDRRVRSSQSLYLFELKAFQHDWEAINSPLKTPKLCSKQKSKKNNQEQLNFVKHDEANIVE